MIDLERVATEVKAKVPTVGVYPLPHGSRSGAVDFRMPEIKDRRKDGCSFRFTLTVDGSGDILGAWPCRTNQHRALVRAVVDAVAACPRRRAGAGRGRR